VNRKIVFYSIFAICAGGLPAMAAVEPNYTHHEPRAVTPWYGTPNAQERQADLDFITGMRPHHAGALTMSEEYLNDPQAANDSLKQLARGIIRNQEFEIGMLDTVQKNLADASGKSMQQIATKGLAQRQKFTRSPMPGPLDAWAGSKEISERDVQFAKAMIIHHQAALDMAHEYLRSPQGQNGYLEKMCLDILVDQSQEIAFMQAVIDDYPGDAALVKIDDSMIHGMDHMQHAKHKPASAPAMQDHQHHH
jgi:uncharacterized protein (DUF305 family)